MIFQHQKSCRENKKNLSPREGRGEPKRREKKKPTSGLLFILLRNLPSELVHELAFLAKSPARIVLQMRTKSEDDRCHDLCIIC